MNDCIFCKIAANSFDTDFVLETHNVVVFNDLNPQAPVHLLVVPREHYDSLEVVKDKELLGEMITCAKNAMKKLDISDYRIVLNTGADAGQSVFHIHMHALGGRKMLWPPG